MKVLVSACLLGVSCRYDGQSKVYPLAEELCRSGIQIMNTHGTIYIVSPEYSAGQMIVRDNILPMIQGKNVLLLSATYIPLGKLGWSLLTVVLSGQIIGWIQKIGQPKA